MTTLVLKQELSLEQTLQSLIGLPQRVMDRQIPLDNERGCALDQAFIVTEIDTAAAVNRVREQELDWVLRVQARIHAGQYGICERCGQEIPNERMEAHPTATMCIPCQTMVDQRARLITRRSAW